MFIELPEDILTIIYTFCDHQSQLILLGTCKKLFNFYKPEKISKVDFNINFLCYNKVEIYEYFKKWLIHDQQFYYFLALNSDNTVIKYIFLYEGSFDTKTLWEGASTNDNLDLIKWLISHKQKYYEIAFAYACKYGNVNILQYLNSKRFRKLYKKEYSQLAAEHYHINVLEWLNKNNLEILVGDIYQFIMNDSYINVWIWLYESGNLININKNNKLCRLAVYNGSHKLLKWLISIGCYVDFETMLACINTNNYDMFEWLINHIPDFKLEFKQPYILVCILTVPDSRFQDWYHNNISSNPTFY